MGRPIKFRAWDGEKMLEHVKTMALSRGRKLVISIVQHDDAQVEETYTEIPNPVLMQYTGLKDKHGREIYEDDCVAHEDGDKFQVIFSAPNFRIYPIEDGKSNLTSHWDEAHDSWEEEISLDNRAMGFEIIGNVHESPELLTPTKTDKQ